MIATMPRADSHARDRVSRYEARFAGEAGATHAVSFAYARTALIAILRAAGLEPGDEVVLSPLTCKIVPLALLAAGLRPAYADIRADTLNLDAAAATRAVTARTRAILFQHTYGLPGGAQEAAHFAQERDLPLVEDRAQCLPARRPRPYTACAAIYSNNAGKPLPAGSGGMAVTDDAALARAVREQRAGLPRRHASSAIALRIENAARNRMPPSFYWAAYRAHRWLRSGSEMDLERELASEVQAAALCIGEREADAGERWLERLEAVRRHRAECCAEYAWALRGVTGVRMIRGADEPALYYFPVLVEDKPGLLREAMSRRIQVIAWPITTPIYPVERASDLSRYGYAPGSCPVAEDVARRLVGLPTDLTIGSAHRAAVVRLAARR